MAEVSAFLPRLIATHVAKLARAFDESVLPVRTFLDGRGLVAKLVDRSPGQLCRLTLASSWCRLGRRRNGEGLVD
jgi:hypothetical protein